jgi:hypothetical protein
MRRAKKAQDIFKICSIFITIYSGRQAPFFVNSAAGKEPVHRPGGISHKSFNDIKEKRA